MPTQNPSTQSTPSSASFDPNDPILQASSLHERAWELHYPEIQAIERSALVAINLDIPSSTSLALSHLKGIRALREDVVRKLPAHDLVRFDSLETCALAAGYGHARYLVAAAPVPILPELNEEAVSLREQLDLEITVLARRGLIDPGRLGELKGPVGYKNLAYDLIAMGSLLKESWSSIAGKTAIVPADIERSKQVGEKLVLAVAARDEKPEKVAEAALDRQRAFTLFSRTYDCVRQAVIYLRWNEGDADILAPSLFRGRGLGRRRAGEEPSPEPTFAATAPFAPAPMNPADPGLPDGNPFTS